LGQLRPSIVLSNITLNRIAIKHLEISCRQSRRQILVSRATLNLIKPCGRIEAAIVISRGLPGVACGK
jgi:hypothetical protein